MARRRGRPDRPDVEITAETSLDRWEAWVDHLDDHPLDRFEYEALLLHRDLLGREVEVAGLETLHDRLDALDVRFQDLTIEELGSPFARDGRLGWWWARLPSDDESRGYTLG